METLKFAVIRQRENGEREQIGESRSEHRAQNIAHKAAKEGRGQIYITWYRESDGQAGYLNRDGHNPVGKAW